MNDLYMKNMLNYTAFEFLIIKKWTHLIFKINNPYKLKEKNIKYKLLMSKCEKNCLLNLYKDF